jgi:hypothetical protein
LPRLALFRRLLTRPQADLFPPAPLITPTARPGAVSVNPLGLDATSTLADVASALAMEKRGFSALKSPSGASKLRTPQGALCARPAR